MVEIIARNEMKAIKWNESYSGQCLLIIIIMIIYSFSPTIDLQHITAFTMPLIDVLIWFVYW